MIRTVGEPCYDEIAMAGIDRLVHGGKPKREGLELIMDNEIGPDVRYILSTNDISLVKRFLMGPITPAEFRELNHKLMELRGRELTPDDVIVRCRFNSKTEETVDDIFPNTGDGKDKGAEKPDSTFSVVA